MSIAQWEREAIIERTQEAMNELKRRGIRTGGAGYGWQWSKKPDATGRKQRIPHPEEQAAVRRIGELHRQGLGIRTIAQQLGREGIPARKSKPWEPQRPTLSLQKERILPARCDVWHAASVLDLLGQPIPPSVDA